MTLSLHRSMRAILSILVITCGLFGVSPSAATYTLAPVAFQTVLDTNGNPVSGAKICTYLAGTTTQTATYSDSIGTQNANPIRADSSGRFVAYLLPGASYKFVFQDASGTVGTCDGVAIRTQDNISAVPPVAGNLDITGTAGEALTAGQVAYLSDGSGSKTAGSWYKADNTNTYSSTLPPLGMVPSSIASGAAGTIRIAGSVTGLAGLVVGGPYYVGTGGALTATQPVNGRRVGNADTTSSLVLVASPLGYVPAQTVITTTGNIVLLPLPVSFSNSYVVLMQNATLATVQGMTAGVLGQRVTIFSIGVGQVDLSNLDAAAAAGTKLLNYAQNGVTSLAPQFGSAEFVYDSSNRWRMVSHTQGDYITWTPTFSTNTAATWTGVSIVASKYYLSGRQLHLMFEYSLSSVSAATAAELRFTLPSTMTAAVRSFQTIRVIDNGAAATSGTVFINSVADQFARIFHDLTDGGTWAIAASTTSVRGEFIVNVQ